MVVYLFFHGAFPSQNQTSEVAPHETDTGKGSGEKQFQCNTVIPSGEKEL